MERDNGDMFTHPSAVQAIASTPDTVCTRAVSLGQSGYRSALGITVISLQSGSNGNCYFIEAGGVGIVVDAGISGFMASERLSGYNRKMQSASALFITHEHGDHMRSAGIFNRKFGLPLYCTPGTFKGAYQRIDLGTLGAVSYMDRGKTICFGGLSVETLPTPHDAREPVALIISYDGNRLGLLTDLGHSFAGLRDVMATLDAVIIESNYDEDMLRNGPYPAHLQARIRGPQGHLSNEDSAAVVRECASSRLRWVCLAHLSEQNNTPGKALAVHTKVARGDYEIHMARRDGPVMVS